MIKYKKDILLKHPCFNFNIKKKYRSKRLIID